eukprot:4310223-Prymnesium_polylepis.1
MCIRDSGRAAKARRRAAVSVGGQLEAVRRHEERAQVLGVLPIIPHDRQGELSLVVPPGKLASAQVWQAVVVGIVLEVRLVDAHADVLDAALL